MGKETIQENEDQDGFMFIVISVSKQTTVDVLVHLWELCQIMGKTRFNSLGMT